MRIRPRWVGLLLAAGGLLGRHLTGSGVWAALASLLIGLLAASIAFVLGCDNASLLIGRALSRRTEAAIRRELEILPYVAVVVDLTTLNPGPARRRRLRASDFTDAATCREIEAAGARPSGGCAHVFCGSVWSYRTRRPN